MMFASEYGAKCGGSEIAKRHWHSEQGDGSSSWMSWKGENVVCVQRDSDTRLSTGTTRS
jgi:hypothetical protein